MSNAPLSQQQLQQIRTYHENQQYGQMYDYIAAQIENEPSLAENEKIYYWYSQAGAVNRNDGGDPAAVFIREVAARGFMYGTNGTDGSPPAPGLISSISNEIARRVGSDILESGALPDFTQQLSHDISASFQAGITIGGWGGAFYHWNDIYIDETGAATVGDRIMRDPEEFAKFVTVNAQSVASNVTLFNFQLLRARIALIEAYIVSRCRGEGTSRQRMRGGDDAVAGCGLQAGPDRGPPWLG